ncbi:glycoside hydrolase family 5 protein [Schizophyllum amplum]|uniref:Glycoside hydrolase family 5 protein n=1 Tax=Schizophyllum amplum TaxID=97359 RepID=A0A550CHD6_9AGAR|nr:glycoside hydrolase family 5 protein [Auriculariopsis ampla]
MNLFLSTAICLAGVSAAAQTCQLRTVDDGVQVPFAGTGDNGTQTSAGTSSSASASASATATSSSSPAATSMPAFTYGSDPMRGVNLGGWLVLEPWITPSFFEDTGNDDIIDEYTLGELMDEDEARSMLKDHWSTWITEQDFIDIAAAGLTHVRIPLGYWSVPVTSADTNYSTSVSPYLDGAWPYLLQGLNWARAHGVRVIVDVHGAPGSQNGYDNSGQRTGNPEFANNDNVQRTLDLVRFLAENIGGMVDVLELLNEGGGFRGDDWASAIRGFFQDGYDIVRETAGNDVKVMIGDAFLGVGYWDGFLNSPDAQGTIMDYHMYQIFSNDELARSNDEHISFACTKKSELTSYANSNIWTIVGEWSNAPTDCTKWLNGRGVGARWDNSYATEGTGEYFNTCSNYTGSYDNFSDDYKDFLRRYWEVQVDVGESVSGWVYWTWKAENSDDWSYQKGLEGGWIPSDPDDRLYSNICS